MDKGIPNGVVVYLHQCLENLDPIVFPGKKIKIHVVRSPDETTLVRYVPNKSLAVASGIQELFASEEESEIYQINYSEQIAETLSALIYSYEFCFGAYYPKSEHPDILSILMGVAAHEVRHRIQLNLRPTLSKIEDAKEIPGQIAVELWKDQIFPSGASPQLREAELDARFIEVAVVLSQLSVPSVDPRIKKILLNGLK